MKQNQTISIEQKYGKYLFDKKIKTKNILSKQVVIKAKEKVDINEKKRNYKINDLNEDIDEKKKIIQIIQSFEDPSDNISLENLSFISQDSQLTIQLKEELPKIRNESIKSDFFSSSFLNSDNIKNDINNIIDLKKNIFMEPLLNPNKYNNLKKSIKIIKNDINEKNIDDIDKDKNDKDIKNKGKNINGINNNEKNENNKDISESEKNNNKDDNENDVIISKKSVIIKALIYFNRDGIINGIENFKKRVPDLNKSKFEEDNKFEKNIYLRIEDRIREILNKSKYDKLSQLREFENNYIVRIINFQKKNINYKYICVKGIIIGLLNIINGWIGKDYLKSSEEKSDYENGDFIIELIEKYETMKKICTFLEKDFIIFIKEFNEENKFEFKLINIFTDLYWDYVFRIKEINIFFTNNFNSEKIDKKTNEAIDNIVNILIEIDLPYKKILGEILNMTCIYQENIFLMNYIIKYKKALNQYKDINIDSILQKFENKLNGSSSKDKLLNEEKNNIISIDTNNPNNESNNISNISTNINEGEKNDLNLGKSLSMDATCTKLSDKDSLEKVYNFILYGENESDKKKQKKKNKKRKKNKNNIFIYDENYEEQIDPVVEEYKNYINNLNSNNNEIVKKVKPKLKKEWINYISSIYDIE